VDLIAQIKKPTYHKMDYNVYKMAQQYQEHKDMIHSHLSGNADTMNNTTLMEMGITAFFVIFLFMILSWVIALYLLIKYWYTIPDWAKAVGAISFAVGYPVITIIVVLGSNAATKLRST
jgi:hypothetical protein